MGPMVYRLFQLHGLQANLMQFVKDVETSVFRIAFVVLVAACFGACGGGDKRPSPTQPSLVSPPAPGPVIPAAGLTSQLPTAAANLPGARVRWIRPVLAFMMAPRGGLTTNLFTMVLMSGGVAGFTLVLGRPRKRERRDPRDRHDTRELP